jgi:hypothetical protein
LNVALQQRTPITRRWYLDSPDTDVPKNLKEIIMKKIALIAAMLVAGISAATAQTAQRYDNYDNLSSYSAQTQNDASQANKIVGGENGGA